MSRVRAALCAIVAVVVVATSIPDLAAGDTTTPSPSPSSTTSTALTRVTGPGPIIACAAQQLGLPPGSTLSWGQVHSLSNLTCSGLGSVEDLGDLWNLRRLTLTNVSAAHLDLVGHPLLVELAVTDSPALKSVTMTGGFGELFGVKITNNAALATVDIAKTGDAGPVRFTGNPRLTDIRMPANRQWSSVEFVNNGFTTLPRIDRFLESVTIREPNLARATLPAAPQTRALEITGTRLDALSIPAGWSSLTSVRVNNNPRLIVISVPNDGPLTTIDIANNNISQYHVPRLYRLGSSINASKNAIRDVRGLQAMNVDARDQKLTMPATTVGRTTAHGIHAWAGQDVAVTPYPVTSKVFQAVASPGSVTFTRPGTHTHSFTGAGEGHYFGGTLTVQVTGSALPTATFRPAEGFPKLVARADGYFVMDPGPIPAGTKVMLCLKNWNHECGMTRLAPNGMESYAIYLPSHQQPVTSRTLYTNVTPPPIDVGDLYPFNHPSRAELLYVNDDGRGVLQMIPGTQALTQPFKPSWTTGWTDLRHIVKLRGLDNNEGPGQLVVDAAGDLKLYSGTGLRVVGKGWQDMDILTNAQHLTGKDTHFLIARRKSDGGLFRYTISRSGTVSGAVQIGWRWTGMTSIVGVGDFNRDGIADVQAVRHDGTLWLYLGTTKGELVAGKKVGQGWSGYRRAFSPGDLDGDGVPDLIGLRHDNTMWFCQGRPNYWAPGKLLLIDVPVSTQWA